MWILQTLPVTVQEILRSKRRLSYLMGIPAAAVVGVCLIVAFASVPETWAVLLAMPFAFLFFSVLFGQILNLKFPDLEWTSPMSVLKRSRAVMITVFTAMGLGMGALLASIFLGMPAAVIVCAALFIIDYFMYRKLCTWGVERFRHLGYD